MAAARLPGSAPAVNLSLGVRHFSEQAQRSQEGTGGEEARRKNRDGTKMKLRNTTAELEKNFTSFI